MPGDDIEKMFGSLGRRIGTAGIAIGVVTSLVVGGAADAGDPFTDEAIVHPSVNEDLVPIGHGRMAERGSLSFTLYRTRFGWKPYAHVRDTSSTAGAHVALPEDSSSTGGWEDASYAVSSANELWVLSGVGPVRVRRYRLNGSPVPTTATLLSTTTFGDTDSRAGALTVLSSGAVVGVWHQQGTNGPNGLGVAYWNGSTWTTSVLDFMPTMASKQALVQHPSDGSVWLFNNPDAWHGIGVAHLSEAPGGLRVDWTDPSWIDVPKHGDFGPDPENPDIEAAADPSTGRVVLAYQGNVRRTFSWSPTVTGSYPVLARIPATGAPTFTSLPVYVERISSLGLVTRPGETWLAYRPVDQATFSFSDIHVARYDTAAAHWDAPVALGTAYDTYGRIGFGVTRVELTARMADGRIHRFSMQPAPTPSTTTSTTSSTTSTTSPTSTSTKPAKKSPRSR